LHVKALGLALHTMSATSNSPGRAPQSVHSEHTDAFFLKKEIDSLVKEQCNFKKQSGYFIRKTEFDELQARVDQAMINGSTTYDPSTLIEMNQQLTDMTARAERAERMLRDAEDSAKENATSLADARKALHEATEAAKHEKTRLELEKSALKGKLGPLEDLQKQARKQASDPEEVAARTRLITELQSQLAAVNAAFAAETAKVRTSHAKVIELEASLNCERLKAERAQKAVFNPKPIIADEPLKPLEPFEADLAKDGAVLRRVLSTESLALLHKCAEVRRENTREYAYSLLEVAKRRDPRNHVGYRDYAKMVVQKIKSTSARKRAKYQPLLDSLYDSMAFENTLKLKEIKATYRTLLEPQSKESEANSEKVQAGAGSWWDDLLYDAKLLFRRAKVEFLVRTQNPETTGWFSSLRAKTWAFCGKLKSILPFSWFSSPTPTTNA